MAEGGGGGGGGGGSHTFPIASLRVCWSAGLRSLPCTYSSTPATTHMARSKKRSTPPMRKKPPSFHISTLHVTAIARYRGGGWRTGGGIAIPPEQKATPISAATSKNSLISHHHRLPSSRVRRVRRVDCTCQGVEAHSILWASDNHIVGMLDVVRMPPKNGEPVGEGACIVV